MYIARILYICNIDRAFYYTYIYIYIYINTIKLFIYILITRQSVYFFLLPGRAIRRGVSSLFR